MKCPYCKSDMSDPPVTVALTKKQRMLYEFILSHGPAGASQETIIDVYFQGRSTNTMRSCIFNINQVIYPSRIKGRGKAYFIV